MVRAHGPSSSAWPSAAMRPARIASAGTTGRRGSMVRKRPFTRCRSRAPSQDARSSSCPSALPVIVPPAATAAAPWMNLRRVNLVIVTSLVRELDVGARIFVGVLAREPAVVHQLLQPMLDAADVAAVVSVERLHLLGRERRDPARLAAQPGAGVRDGEGEGGNIE